jgi:predicted secreted protein
MKYLQNLLFIASFFAMVACGGNSTSTENTEDTAQKDSVTTEEEPKEKVPSLSEDDKKSFAKKWQMVSYVHADSSKEQSKEDEVIALNEDGKFELLFNEKSIAGGSWGVEVQDSVKIITLMHESGPEKDLTEKLTVKEVSADKLVTVDDSGKMTETYKVAKK